MAWRWRTAQVVAAAVTHAMEATRGRRELYARYEGDPDSAESMYDLGAGGQSHVADAKAAAEARGEYTFAKMDHLGIQARRVPQSRRMPAHLLVNQLKGAPVAALPDRF